ncbi:ABC transporter substrate-binding protein [Streptococcus sp. X16XC17]|uniref:ABC transporter substrate-binding protein n=1 Tax=unclassified Streptococcus TaxID=2608887 RepID=UPI00066FE6D5|nr:MULTISPECIES: ABC transporter substrate-binding protein [unclassified Streptococcus]TCD46642.1 ABC transporter substrate-binding protein [Streptococcus sp. X16XC17]
MEMKKWMLAIASFASAVLLTACSDVPTSNTAAGDAAGTKIGTTIKVGFNLELSGVTSSYGQFEEKGAKLAIKEINADGGVDGKKLQAISKDNKSETAEAATVATALTSEGANIIIGPATSGASGASISSVTSAGVPMISPSGTQTNLVADKSGKVQDYFFRATFTDENQAEFMAEYATANLQAKKVVLYYDNSSDYAKGIADTFKDSFDGEVVAEATFASGDKDFQAAITKFKNADFDAIVMPGYYNETGSITKQIREAGIDAPILGPDGFDSPQFAQLATKSASNSVYYLSAFVISASEKAQAFYDAYVAEYGEEPSMFSALAYDAVHMAAKAAEGAKTSIDIKNNLAALKDFEGVTGTVSIDKEHNVVKTVYVVGLKNGEQDTIDTIRIDK